MTDDYNWRRGNNRWLILGKLECEIMIPPCSLELPLVPRTELGKDRGTE